MRKILLLFLLLPFFIKAQLYSPATLFGKNENRLNVWYNLSIPNDTLHPMISLQHLPHIAATPASGKFWIWSTTLLRWIEITGGGGVSTNIYTANGTLTGARTLTAAGFDLTFTGTNNYALLSSHANSGFGPDFWTEFRTSPLSASMTAFHGVGGFASINVNTSNGGDPIVNIQTTGGPGASRLTWYPDSLLFSITTGKVNFPFLRQAFDTTDMQGIVPVGITKWGGIVKMHHWIGAGGGGTGPTGGDILFGNVHKPFYDTLAYFPTWDTAVIKMKAIDIRADLAGKITVERPSAPGDNTDSTLTWVINVDEAQLQLGLMGGAVQVGQGGVPVGGLTGQVLGKLSNADRDIGWVAGGGGGISGLTTGALVYAASATTIATRSNIVPTATGLDLTDSRIMLKKTGTGASEVYLTADNFGLEIRNNFFGNDGFRLLPAGLNLQFQSTGVGDFLFMPAQVEKMRLYSDGNFRLIRLASGGTSPTMDGTVKMLVVDTDGDFGFQTVPSGGGAEVDPVFTASEAFNITATNKTNWTAAYNDKVNSAAFSGTTTKTLTLTQQDGGTVTATFTDNNNTYTGTDFILNQSASSQAGAFWINGTGTVNNLTVSSIGVSSFSRMAYFDNTNTLQAANILPSDIVVTYGSYSDPSWITGLSYTKITGVTGNSKYVGTNSGGTYGVYDLPTAPTFTINDATDVTITTIANNQLLRYNSSTTQWENWTPNFITGNQTITLTGDITGSGTTAITTAIASNTVALGDIQQITTARFLGRTTAATGDVEQLTGTQATAMLNVFTSTLQGLAPASGGGTTNFLRADGAWAAPPGGGGSGTVTDFSAGDLSGLFTTSEATTTTTPALTFTAVAQPANKIFAGPAAAGPDAVPTFRALTNADIPSGITMTKVSWSGTAAQYVAGDGSLVTFPTSNTSFTNGAGYITNSNAFYDLAQGAQSAPAAGKTRVYSTGNSILNFTGSTGFVFTLDGSGFTAARSFAFPDLGGTVVTNNATQTLTSKTVTFTAGTASVAPITLTSGTNLTTAVAGSAEFDGKTLYFTPQSTERGVVSIEQICALNTAYTLSNATGAQPIFAAAGGADAIGLSASTTYVFESLLNITTAATTTRTIAIDFGGTATITNIMFETEYAGGATAGTVSAWSQTMWTAAAGGVINATNTNVSNRIRIKGVVRINAAGTFIPRLNFSAAPGTTNTTNVNSYFRIWPIGSGTINTVGNWQ